jgi:hypothetical protein
LRFGRVAAYLVSLTVFSKGSHSRKNENDSHS